MAEKEAIRKLKSEFEDELFKVVLPFWEKHSPDREHGGYYNCLDREGRLIDTTKYMWLHGRQIWMFSKLYNTWNHDNSWLSMASHGMEFMKKNALAGKGRVYFSLNEMGAPVYLQRKIFTECFYTMALSEYGKAIGSEELIAESMQMFRNVLALSRDATLLGRQAFAGEAPLMTLAIPMILLNVMEEVYGKDFQPVKNIVDQCIAEVKMHFVDGIVYENILKSGRLHNSSLGRLLNPGHAIEAGWFLLHWASILNDQQLRDQATEMVRTSFSRGWDSEFGGLFYFMDAENKAPLKLEWDMKLWWPHCEAMYAFLLIYSFTKDPADWQNFLSVKEYVFSHFSDRDHGEWFGYLNREGKVSLDLKGGPYKGCFHVPRSLLLCLNVLKSLSNHT